MRYMLVIAGGILLLAIIRQRWLNHRRNPKYPRSANRVGVAQIIAVVAAMLVLLAVLSHRHTANADNGGGGTTTTTPGKLLSCPSDINNPLYSPADKPDFGLDSGEHFAATGGSLVGNGSPINTSDPKVAAAAILDRLSNNPKLLANLAYALRLDGFTPKDEVRGQISATVSFLDSRVQALIADRVLWQQTIREACPLLVNGSATVQTAWKDRNVLELATRPATGNAIPTTVLLDRDPRPDGMRLYWVWRFTDDTGERSSTFPVAIDLRYVWPVIVGEVPELAERQAPDTTTTSSSTTTTSSSAAQQGGGQQNQGQGKQGGTPSSSPSGPGSGSSCGGSCGSSGQGGGTGTTSGAGGGSGTGTGSGSGSGSGSGGGCSGTGCSGGGTTTTGGSGCGACTTSTTRPTTTTTRPPTTTIPPTTTTRPPTTSTTSPPTTAPPSTTTTVEPKDPPPPCFPWIPYPEPGSCPPGS